MLRLLVAKRPFASKGEIVLSSNASNSTIASLALAVGVVNLAGLLFLIIMAVVGSPWGTLNDICNGVGAVLSVALALALHPQLRARDPRLAIAALVVVILGALIATLGSVLVMSGRTGFFLAGMYTMTGYALIGLWLLAVNRGGALPQALVLFGLIAGAVMVLGLAAIPSIFMRIDSFGTAAWHTWVGQMGFIGWAILYPIWCLRLWGLLRAA
jgi:hypothetical protein